MDLYLFRHGEAGQHTADADDGERRLTEAGRTEVREVAKRLAALGVRPATIYTSPLARARETAEIAAEELGLRDRVRVVDRLAGCPPGDVQAIISQPAGDVMLVGHNPDFELLTRWLTGARCILKKAGVAKIRTDAIEPGTGTLMWLLSPKVLRT